MEIISEMASAKTVETMVANIAHAPLDDDLRDLSQMVYLALLESDPAKIVAMYQSKQLHFFVSKIITNQYRTKNSPWHNAFRKRQAQADQIENHLDYVERD